MAGSGNAVVRFSSSRFGAWLFSHLAHRADRLVLRLTKGRSSFTSILTDQPLVTLTTIGAKRGVARSLPLLGIPDGEKYVLIASRWGSERHPGWYYNLTANPEVKLNINGRSGDFIAREVNGPERDRCWRLALELYPGFANYERWSGDRRIPVIVLAPKPE
jgi:deazaflavin-dependent oxidoreductase (nitroreductase family)